MLLEAVPLSGGLGVRLVLGCDPPGSLGGFALGKDGEAVLVPALTMCFIVTISLVPRTQSTLS